MAKMEIKPDCQLPIQFNLHCRLPLVRPVKRVPVWLHSDSKSSYRSKELTTWWNFIWLLFILYFHFLFQNQPCSWHLQSQFWNTKHSILCMGRSDPYKKVTFESHYFKKAILNYLPENGILRTKIFYYKNYYL